MVSVLGGCFYIIAYYSYIVSVHYSAGMLADSPKLDTAIRAECVSLLHLYFVCLFVCLSLPQVDGGPGVWDPSLLTHSSKGVLLKGEGKLSLQPHALLPRGERERVHERN